MNNINENKISACLVVYNEEKVIRRCLENIKDVVDEIIVVFDGKSSDNTLEIVKEYTDKIYILDHRGAMEFHVPFVFNKAKHDWILRIDGDEYLSNNLKDNIKSLIKDEKTNAYEFLWPLWDGKKYITSSWPYKKALFRKDKISFLSLIHYDTKVLGKVERVPFLLEHRPEYNNYSFKSFERKACRWAKIQAEIYVKDFSFIGKFNYQGDDWPMIIKLRKRFPLLLIPFEFLVTIFKNLRNGKLRDGSITFKVALSYASYRVMVNYYLFKAKGSIKFF